MRQRELQVGFVRNYPVLFALSSATYHADHNLKRCLSPHQPARLQRKRRLRCDGDSTAGLRRARRGPGVPRVQLPFTQVHGQ